MDDNPTQPDMDSFLKGIQEAVAQGVHAALIPSLDLLGDKLDQLGEKLAKAGPPVPSPAKGKPGPGEFIGPPVPPGFYFPTEAQAKKQEEKQQATREQKARDKWGDTPDPTLGQKMGGALSDFLGMFTGRDKGGPDLGRGGGGMAGFGARMAEYGRTEGAAGNLRGGGIAPRVLGAGIAGLAGIGQALAPTGHTTEGGLWAETGEMGGVGKGLMAFGSALGPVGKAVTGLAAAALMGAEKLQEWNHALMKANFQFAEFSGAMSAARANSMVRQINLSRERGDRRAGSAEYLAQRSDNLDRAMAPIQDLIGSAKNHLFGFISEKLAGMFDVLNGILTFFGVLGDSNTNATEWNQGQWLAEVGRNADWGGDFGDPWGRPGAPPR